MQMEVFLQKLPLKKYFLAGTGVVATKASLGHHGKIVPS